MYPTMLKQKDIYDKTYIDDCIIVTYTYRNNNIEDMQIKYQN